MTVGAIRRHYSNRDGRLAFAVSDSTSLMLRSAVRVGFFEMPRLSFDVLPAFKAAEDTLTLSGARLRYLRAVARQQ